MMFPKKNSGVNLKHAIMTPRLQMSLEAQAVKEGLLQRADYAMGEVYPVPNTYGQQDFDSRILPYLSIFPDVTLSRGDFLLGPIASTGLSVDLIEPRLMRWPTLRETMEAAHFKELVTLSNRDALTICKAQKNEMISITSSMVNSDISNAAEKHLQRQSFMPVVTFLSKYYLTDVAATPFQGLGYEEQIAREHGFPLKLMTSPQFIEWLDKVDDFYVRLLATVFHGRREDEKLSVGNWWGGAEPTGIRPEGALEAWDVLVQFKEELRILPDPRTIAEAVEFGSSKEMGRVRQLMTQWLDEVGSTNGTLEAKIRADIAKASNELKRLNRWKEFYESPVVFGSRIVAGQIPIISNVVSLVDGASWAFERWTTRRNCWVALKRSR